MKWHRLLSLFGLAFLGFGCAESASTQVVVLMDTDYETPAEVDRIRARVSKVLDTETGTEERETWVREFAVTKNAGGSPDAHTLPATFGILPGSGDSERDIVIELEALEGGSERALVSRRVRTGFMRGETRLLRMHLYRACAAITCSSGESCGCADVATCTAPSCIDEAVPAEDLELISDSGVLPGDAGIPMFDAGIPGSGIPDAGIPDSGIPDGSVPDGGTVNCEPPLTICGSDCVNADADPRYCGDCETACMAGDICESGRCIDPGDCRTNDTGCTGFSYCDEETGECLPGCTDSAQCVGDEEVCDLDLRACVCDSGLARCGSVCVDTQNNPLFCGDCITVCDVGHICELGVCVDPDDCRTNGIGCTGFTYCDEETGDCLPGCDTSTQCTGDNEVCDPELRDCVCDTGFDQCPAGCVNTQNDPSFCGDCERECPIGNVCVVGNCLDPGDCRTNGIGCIGFTYCDAATGECLRGCDDNAQCTGDNEVCDIGVHDCVCATGSHLCGAVCLPDDDINSCGTSCTPCQAPTDSTPTCELGVCDFVCADNFERCDDACCPTSCPPGQLLYNRSCAEFHVQTATTQGNTGEFSSIAIGADDLARIACYASSGRDLRYLAQQVDASWVPSTPDGPNEVGRYASIAVGPSGLVHVAYYDASDRALMLGTRLANGTWVLEQVDVGDVGEHNALTVDAGGTAHISYYDKDEDDLKYARRTSGSAWAIETVDSDGIVGQHTSIAVGADGTVHVSYYDSSSRDLKYAQWQPAGAWRTQTVASAGNVGKDTSIALDAEGVPHISFYGESEKDFLYATRLVPGSWAITTIESTGDVGKDGSLAFGPDGAARVSYYDETNRDLKYAIQLPNESWAIQTIDSVGDIGRHTSIAVDDLGNAHIAYEDRTNDNAKYAVVAAPE